MNLDATNDALLRQIAHGLGLKDKPDALRFVPADVRAHVEGLLSRAESSLAKEERAQLAAWRAMRAAAEGLMPEVLAQLHHDRRVRDEVRRERARRDARRVLASEGSRRPMLVWDGDEEVRAPEYLIDGLLPAEGAGMLFGETNVGKTFVAVSLATSVAAGSPWFGRRAERGTVLFFESEGGRSFARRRAAAKAAAGLDSPGPLFERFPFVTVYESLGFGPDTDASAVAEQAAFVRQAVEARGMPPVRLVVVDTLAQNMSGDSDSNVETSAFLRAFRSFVKNLSSGPVFGLLLHHPGHANKDRGRGAYALAADLDLVAQLTGDADALTLSCKKLRDDAPFHPIALALVPRDGSLVVAARELAASETPTRDPVRDAVLAALPEYPDKASVASLLPTVAERLGKPIGKESVATLCLELERSGLAVSARGRQRGSLVWGQAEESM